MRKQYCSIVTVKNKKEIKFDNKKVSVQILENNTEFISSNRIN